VKSEKIERSASSWCLGALVVKSISVRLSYLPPFFHSHSCRVYELQDRA
jgi:hypothetical protein